MKFSVSIFLLFVVVGFVIGDWTVPFQAVAGTLTGMIPGAGRGASGGLGAGRGAAGGLAGGGSGGVAGCKPPK